jgi:hypothetical protein
MKILLVVALTAILLGLISLSYQVKDLGTYVLENRKLIREQELSIAIIQQASNLLIEEIERR